MPLDDKVQAALDTIFTAASELYANRGWNVRSGFGKRPALLNIDLANAWTRPGYKFSCDDMDESMDGEFDSARTSAGFGTDEDYGYFGD